MQDCECKGHDYAGMPTLDLLTNKTKASVDQDSNLYYSFPPSQFELFPKVNPILRTTFCSLGIWNLYTFYPKIDQLNTKMDEWGLGQVFIRQNGLNLTWKQSENNDWYAVISMKKASDTFSRTFGIVMACFTLFALSLCVGLLTRQKFKRIKQ